MAALAKSHKKEVRRKARSKRDRRNREDQTGSKHFHCLLPVDTCAILQHTGEGRSDSERIIAVLVDRFMRSKIWPSSKFILWFRLRETADNLSETNADEAQSPELLLISKSTSTPDLMKKTDCVRAETVTNKNITGTLLSGEKYYVCRFQL